MFTPEQKQQLTEAMRLVLQKHEREIEARVSYGHAYSLPVYDDQARQHAVLASRRATLDHACTMTNAAIVAFIDTFDAIADSAMSGGQV